MSRWAACPPAALGRAAPAPPLPSPPGVQVAFGAAGEPQYITVQALPEPCRPAPLQLGAFSNGACEGEPTLSAFKDFTSQGGIPSDDSEFPATIQSMILGLLAEEAE